MYGLDALSRLDDYESRSISAENRTGARGAGGQAMPGPNSAAHELGQGWKASPYVDIAPGETFELASIDGPGAIKHIWCTGRRISRDLILRAYWDNQAQPSVECPLGDFFGAGWGPFAQISSTPVAVNPNNGLNCYWQMPFRRSARLTLENRGMRAFTCFYQVDYALTNVDENAAYFYAQFRRANPLPYKSVYTILEATGDGQYVGTYLAVGVTNTGWWGEGEIKFYIDGDRAFPTICGTGTEDYFGGAYNWDVDAQYTTYTTPYLGMHQVLKPDGLYRSQMRFGMYRWHIPDPIRFRTDLSVTLQALGWRSEGRYLPLQCDIASVAYWYQRLPAAAFPELPDHDYLEVI